MTIHETSLEIEGAGGHPPVRRQVPAPGVTRRNGRRRGNAIDAFLNAHRSITGAPSGGIDARITVSANPSKWRYSSELITSEKFELSNLKKSVLKVTACIGWDWANRLRDNAWEAPLSEAKYLFLGAAPVTPPDPAEAAWHIRAVGKRPTTVEPYILGSLNVLALQLGPVCALRPFDGRLDQKVRARGAISITEAVRKFTLSRLVGQAS